MIEQYYQENRDTCVKRITRRCHNVTDAEDIVQDAFERALRYKNSLDTAKDVGAWFNTILNNSFRDWQKKERLQGMSVELTEENGGEYVSPTEAQNLSTEILDMIKEKKPLSRNILTLHLERGYTPRDIARVLDTTTKHINMVVFRFKQQVKERYDEEE
jgi:RNA polymerase sigma-70 factor (ECF subfamily)